MPMEVKVPGWVTGPSYHLMPGWPLIWFSEGTIIQHPFLVTLGYLPRDTQRAGRPTDNSTQPQWAATSRDSSPPWHEVKCEAQAPSAADPLRDSLVPLPLRTLAPTSNQACSTHHCLHAPYHPPNRPGRNKEMPLWPKSSQVKVFDICKTFLCCFPPWGNEGLII